MKTLVLNGSPRSGNTAQLVQKVLEAGHGKGEVICFDLYKMQFSACINCGGCAGGGKCVFRDLDEIFQVAEECDNIIVASPVFFGVLTPPMMGLLSRFQRYFSEVDFARLPKVGKEKRGVIVLTGGGISGLQNRAEIYARLICKMLNTSVVDVVTAFRTNTLPVSADNEAIESAKRAGEILFYADKKL